MRKLFLVSLFTLLACTFQLQFAGIAKAQWVKLASPEERTYNLQGFNKIILSNPAEVSVRQTNEFAVSARSKYKGALDILKLEVRNNTLYITSESLTLKTFPEIDVYVTMPKLEEATLNGSGEIDLKGAFTGDLLRVTLNGSGVIDIDDAKLTHDFVGSLNGSGDLKFGRLETTNLQLSLQGSGDIEAKRLSARNEANLSLQGSGTFIVDMLRCTNLSGLLRGSGDLKFGQVTFTDKADVELAGSGDIYAKEIKGGNALATTLRGSGDIRYNSLEVDTFDAELYMSGDIYVSSGKAKNVSASVVGSGDMHLRGLRCSAAHVQLQGSGDITLDVRDELYMEHVKGSGEIHYTGNPTLKVKK